MKPSNTKPKFQFSMKTLMLGMTVAALFSAVLGWIGVQKIKLALPVLPYGIIASGLMFFHSIRLLRKLHYLHGEIIISSMAVACASSFIAVLSIQIYLIEETTSASPSFVYDSLTAITLQLISWTGFTYLLAALFAAITFVVSVILSLVIAYPVTRLKWNVSKERAGALLTGLLLAPFSYHFFYMTHEVKSFYSSSNTLLGTVSFFAIWISMPFILLWWADREGRGLNKPPSERTANRGLMNELQADFANEPKSTPVD